MIRKNEDSMIPKKIHYCWFGKGKKPKLAKKCIESWKKFCPDYEIIEWNEDNFDVNITDYTRFTYNNKLYAYLSDYARLWAVYNYGGVYFDTDVELIKTPNELLKLEGYMGFESEKFINTGIGFGAEKNNSDILLMINLYDKLSYDDCAKRYNFNHYLNGSPKMNTNALIPYGLLQNGKGQMVNSIKIFPVEYFCPFNDVTGEIEITDNTISIHWYSKSAQGRVAYIRSKIIRPLRRIVARLGLKSEEE